MDVVKITIWVPDQAALNPIILAIRRHTSFRIPC
jgi:hypothetical protein